MRVALQALGLGAHVGLTLPFSRVHESEADILGLNLMAAAGFDPAQRVSLWENMAANAGDTDTPYELLSTHPDHDTRIANLRLHLEQARQFSGRPVNCG